MQLNIERLRILAEDLRAKSAEQFDLRFWFDKTNMEDLPPAIIPRCTSCACIAGDALVLFAPDTPVDANQISARAAELLGLTKVQASDLFEPWSNLYGVWDEPGYLPAGRERESITAAEAARVIDNLIATGEVDWRVIA